MHDHGNAARTSAREILILDWNWERAGILARALGELGNDVNHVDHLQAATRDNSSVVLISAFWPSHPGLRYRENTIVSLLQQIRTWPGKPDIVVFGCAECGLTMVDCCRWLLEGARYLVDTADPIIVRSHVRQCLKARAEFRENSNNCEEPLETEFGVIYASEEMRQVMERVRRAATLKHAAILVTGPTGSGKQKLAEVIQRLDPWRPNAPVLTVNCAAIPGALAESELFGHRRGSYTGATGDRMGCFRAAHGGTLVLDEIGELDPSLQPKLLRVLETNKVKSLGQDTEVPVEVRVIATTNRDLRAMAADGHFRMDLYQRLAMIEISIPPLAQRSADVLPLMRFFLEKHRNDYNCEVKTIHPAVIEALSNYSFDGNVRELENIVRFILFNKAEGDTIQLGDLPRHVLEQVTSQGRRPACEAAAEYLSWRVVQDKLPLVELLNECESIALKAALRFTGGNRSAAAALLHISERTLYNKLQQWSQSPSPDNDTAAACPAAAGGSMSVSEQQQ